METFMNYEKIIKIADKTIKIKTTQWEMDIEHFDWVPAVGLYGIFCAYRKTGISHYWSFLEEWFARHLQSAYFQKTVNSISPMLTAAYMYEIKPNETYIRVIKDMAQYIIKDAPLTVDGGLEHTVTEKVAGFSDQVWADTLFMVCIFLAKAGKILGNQKYIDFAVNQFVIHHKLLYDGEGLYFHGYNGGTKDHMSAVRWGRANAWIIYSTTAILKFLGDFDQRFFLETQVKKHIEALLKIQDVNGGFRTILDDKESYVEISATAGIAAGIESAIELGLVGKECWFAVQKAKEAVIGSIDENGLVCNVSTGTPVIADKEGYKKIRLTSTLYGQGLALIAL